MWEVKLLEVVARVTLGRLEALANSLSKHDCTINATEATSAILHHLDWVHSWASRISFMTVRTSELRQAFVELDLELDSGSRSRRPGAHFKLSKVLSRGDSLVLFGDPGGGKTTTLKRLALTLLESLTEPVDAAKRLRHQDDLSNKSPLPLVILLRDLPLKGSLKEEVLRVLGVRIEHGNNTSPDDQAPINARFLTDILNTMPVFLLLDGLDEVTLPGRESIIKEIRYLASHMREGRIAVTVRKGEHQVDLGIDNTYLLRRLSSGQVREFAINWLGVEDGKALIAEIARHPYAGTEIRPITLAHFCAIYERTGSIPDRPRGIYRKLVRLLIDEWDEHRLVRRSSAFPKFGSDRKEDFLEAVAFDLTTRGFRTNFSIEQLDAVYDSRHEQFELPSRGCDRVFTELESHTGLIVHDQAGRYQFMHRSIQEYLAGSYIAKMPGIPGPRSLLSLPDEVAVAITLSSDPNVYFMAVAASLVDYAPNDPQAWAEFAPAFPLRLVVEGPELRSDSSLGIAALLLYHKQVHLALQGGFKEAGNEIFASWGHLFKIPAVRIASAQVIQQSRLEPFMPGLFSLTMSAGLRSGCHDLLRPAMQNREVVFLHNAVRALLGLDPTADT